MTDQEYKALRKQIEGYLNWWVGAMGLADWYIVRQYFRDSFPETEEECEGYGVWMDVKPDWRYKTALIRINMPEIAKNRLDDQIIEKSVVHELCHILLHEMRMKATPDDEDDFRDHEEHVVTNLTQAFLRVRARGRREGEET